MKDDRVYNATAKLSYYLKTRALEVDVYLDTMVGEFNLVLGIDSVSITVLRAG